MPKKGNKKNSQKLFPDNVENDNQSELSSEVAADSVVSENGSSSEASTFNEMEAQMRLIEENIDKLYDSNTSTRFTSLKSLYSIFQRKYLNINDEWNHVDTFFDALERLIRRGKPDEQCLAMKLLGLSILQVGDIAVEKWKEQSKEVFESMYRNGSNCSEIRQSSLVCMTMLYFMSADINWNDVRATMRFMEEVWRGSCLKGDGSHPNIKPELSQLHIIALRYWCLLLSIVPSSMLMDIVSPLISKFHQLLKSLDVDMRIYAGYCIAMIYERIRTEVNPRFKGNDYTFMIEDLELLAKDASKSRSKNDRKRQRHSFRDILIAIQSDTVDFPVESIQIGTEAIELKSWKDKMQYDALCSILETGFNNHLRENIHVRMLFGLGLPIAISKSEMNQNKLSHKQKHLANLANAKTRRQNRDCLRRKRENANDILLSD